MRNFAYRKAPVPLGLAAINHHGELLSIKVTSGNVDDRKPVAFLCRALFGRVYADKGYLARWLVDLLRASTRLHREGTQEYEAGSAHAIRPGPPQAQVAD